MDMMQVVHPKRRYNVVQRTISRLAFRMKWDRRNMKLGTIPVSDRITMHEADALFNSIMKIVILVVSLSTYQ